VGNTSAATKKVTELGPNWLKKRREKVHGHEAGDAGGTGVVFVAKGGNDEADEIGEETNQLHPLAAVVLVVDQERCQVVTDEGYSNVDQVVEPGSHNIAVGAGDGLDELALEELVTVEEDIIGVPACGRCKETATKVGESHPKRLDVVTGDGLLLLRLLQMLRGRAHLVDTIVNQPERSNGWNGKRDTVGVLRK